MKREALWKALTEAKDAVGAAAAQLEREATPETRVAWYGAARVYQIRLALVIDRQPVQRYAKRVRAYLDAIDRTVRFGVTMITRTADDADVKFMEGLAGEQRVAAEEYRIAAAEVAVAVELAKARDNEPDAGGRK